jgi:hypothetical protein
MKVRGDMDVDDSMYEEAGGLFEKGFARETRYRTGFVLFMAFSFVPEKSQEVHSSDE